MSAGVAHEEVMADQLGGWGGYGGVEAAMAMVEAAMAME